MRFLSAFNPSRQAEIAKDVKDCICGNHLTLSELANEYGENLPTAWLVPQLVDLSEYCGCKDKITKEQLKSLSRIICSNFAYLKSTELMLFFSWFKSGKYGRFYGNVDPMMIMSALRTYCSERIILISKEEQEEQERKREEEYRLHPPISMEEYRQQHGKDSLPFFRRIEELANDDYGDST